MRAVCSRGFSRFVARHEPAKASTTNGANPEASSSKAVFCPIPKDGFQPCFDYALLSKFNEGQTFSSTASATIATVKLHAK